MEAITAWVVANTDLLMTIWVAVVAIAEVLKRAIPGTKDDTIIVKILDIAGKLATFGGAAFLPKQEGTLKK